MGIFSGILKVGLDVVTLPVAVVKDVVTMGGVLDDTGSSTVEQISKTVNDTEELFDKLP